MHYRGTNKSLKLLLLLAMVTVLPGAAHAIGGVPLWSSTDAVAGKQEAKAMTVDSAGNTIVVGYTGANANDYYVAKFKADGSGTAWPPAIFGGAGEDVATAVTVDSKNNIIVTGYTWNGSDKDIHTIKYCGSADPATDCPGKNPGDVLWQHTLTNTSGNDTAAAVAVDGSDNIYVAGTYFNGVQAEDYVVVKYPSAGAVPTWTELFGDDVANPNKINKILAMAVNSTGIAVTGYSGRGTVFDMITRKYGFDQSLVRQWRHSDSGDCQGKAVRMDAAGNVIVTGSGTNALGNKDIYTVKYDPASDTPLWEKTYNGNSTDEPTGLWVDGAGDAYVTGVTNTLAGNDDFFTARYNGSNGALKWQAVFDAGNDATDIPSGIVVDDATDGGVFVTGYSTVTGNDDFMTLKYRKDTGVLLWEKTFNGSDNKNDRAIGIALEPAGGPVPRSVYVAGWSDSIANGYNYQIVKYDYGALNAPSNLTAAAASDTSINLTWYDNSTNEEKFVIERKQGESGTWGAITPDKTSSSPPNDTTVIPTVPATTYTDSTGLAANNYYYYRIRAWNSADTYSDYSNEARALTKVVSYAAPSWSYLYNGADNRNDVATAITVGTDNHPVVTGYSDLTEEGVEGMYSYDYMTYKLDRVDKSIKWKARYDSGDGGTDMAAGVALDSAGNVLVTGTAYLAGGGDKSDDLYTRKVATAGLNDPAATPAFMWEHQYGTLNGIDLATAIAMLRDGSNNSVVIGHGGNSAVPQNDDTFIIKYDNNGARPWAPLPTDPQATIYDSGRNDIPSAMAFDASGNIFVTGYSYDTTADPSASYDWFTAKYNGATGALIWSDVFDSGFGADKALSVDVDKDGNAYVTGYAKNSDGKFVFHTIKYDGALVPQGTRRIWSASYNKTGFDARAVAVKVDPVDGAVVVGGTSYVSATDSDFHLIRYNPADGAEIWNRNFDRAGYDYATVMTMDASGYIYLAGNTRSGPDTDSDFNASSDVLSLVYDYEGTYLGAMSYPTPTNGRQDEATAITVNNIGEAFIAGFSRNENVSLNMDYIVLKQINSYLLVPGAFTAATQADYTKMDLTWQVPASGPSFKIYRTPGPSNPLSVWTLVSSPGVGAVSYPDTTVPLPGTNYCYAIEAISGSLNSRRTETCATTRLSKPVLDPLTVVSTTQISLSWTQVPGNTGYKIERKIGAGAWADLTTTPAGQNSYTDPPAPPTGNLTPGTTYTYRVSTNSAPGYSLPSTEMSAITKPVAPTLNAPTGVTNTQMVLGWNAPTGAATYTLQKKLSTEPDTSYANITTPNNCTNIAATSCTVTGLTPDTAYNFRVMATNTGGNSVWSNVQPGTAALAVPTWATTPATPTNIFNTGMTLTWVNPVVSGANLTSYELQKEDTTTPSGWVASGCTINGSTLLCNVTGLTPDHVYNFRVRSVNAAGSSGWSTLKTATAALGVPTLNAATAITDSQMTLTWNNNIYNATKYTLQKDGVDVVGCTDISAGTCTVTGLSPNVTYNYKVKSGNADGYSALSNNVAAKTILATPNLISATGGAANIVLTWSAVPVASGYTIEKSTCTDNTTPSTCRGADALYGAWSNHATGVTDTTATISSLTAGTNYRFRITATVSGNSSLASNVRYAWTNLTAPTLQPITPVSSTALTLNWDQQPGETNYTVEVSTTGVGGTYTAIPAATGLAANTITYPHTGLALSTEYCYRIRAYSTETNPPPDAVSTPPQCKTTPPNAPALSSAQVQYESSYTVIEDATKNWTIADYWINQPVVITSGGNIYTKNIAGSVQTALYASPAFTTESINQGDSYVILRTVSGTATGIDTNAPNTSLIDAYKNWGGNNQWTDFKIKITSSINSANLGQERVLNVNGGSSLYFTADAGLPSQVVAGDTYQVASFFGSATAAGTTTQLNHAGAGWTANAWTGYYLMMTSGSNNGHARKISSNTTTTLTTDAFPNASNLADTYLIAPVAQIGSFISKATTGSTASALVDPSTHANFWGGWPLNNWAGYYLLMTSGNNKDKVRKIVSNTAASPATATVSIPFDSSINVNDTYLIGSAAQIASYRGNAAGSPGTSATELVDSANSWGTNNWTGANLIMTSGSNDGQSRVITGMTATTLTVSPPFSSNISASDSYIISALTATKGSGTVSTTVAANPSLSYKGSSKLKLTNGEAEFTSMASGFGNNYNYGLLRINFLAAPAITGAGYWSKQVPVTISNFQANFQTKVTITKANYTGMRDGYEDVRFYDETAKVELPYWIESSNATSATIWFKTGANNNISMYYGNPSSSSASNGSATFDFFDDFNGTSLGAAWTSSVSSGATMTVAGGTITMDAPSGKNISVSKSLTPPYRLESRINNVSAPYMGAGLIRNRVLFSGVGVDAGLFDVGGSYLQPYVGGATNITVPVDQYVRLKAAHTGGSTNAWSVFKEDGTQVYTTTYTGTPVGISYSIGDAGGGSGKVIVDWVFARKYTATEPTATAGALSVTTLPGEFDTQLDYNVLSGLIPTSSDLPYLYLQSSYASARIDFSSPTTPIAKNYQSYIYRGRTPLQETGRAMAYTSATKTLTDNRTMPNGSTPWKNWTTDQWKNYYIQIISGPNNQLVRKITANTANSITLDSEFPKDPSGVSGTAAASGNSNTKLVDSTGTTNWVTNIWANYFLFMDSGPNAGKFMRIASNDATSITVEGTGFASPIASGNSYRISGDYYRINAITGNAVTNGSTVDGLNNTNAVLIDSSKNTGSTLPLKDWTPGQWTGFYLYISSGPNIGLFRTITGNTASSITVDPPFPYQIISGDAYSILDPRPEAQAVEAYWTQIYDPVAGVQDYQMFPTSDVSGRFKFSKTGSSLMLYTAPTGGEWQLRRQLDLSATDAFAPIRYWIYQLGRQNHSAGISEQTKIYNFQITTVPPAATNMNFSSFTPEVGHLLQRPNETPVMSSTPLEISWNKIDAAINGYEVERCQSNDHQTPSARVINSGTCTTFTQAQPSDGTTRIINAASISGLTAGYTYRFRVRAKYNATDYTAYSDERWYTATPSAPVMTAPTAASATTTQLTPTWTNVNGDNGYKLYWKVRSGASCTDDSWNTPIDQAINSTTYNHAGLTPGTFYCYKIKAVGPSGPPVTPDSAYSNIVSQTTKPSAPGTITFSGITASSITLTWPQVTGNNGYQVDRSPDNSTWTTNVGSPGADVNTFTNNTGLSAGTRYYYRVLAKSAGGNSDYSAVQSTLTAPAAPVVTATAISYAQIDLSWPLVVGASSYNVDQKIGAGGSWVPIGTISKDFTQSYCGYPVHRIGCTSLTPDSSGKSVTGLTENTYYCYQVKALNSSGESVASTEKCKTTSAMPLQNLTATALDGGFKIRLDWVPFVCLPIACDAPTGYELQRQVWDDNWVLLKTLDGATLTYTDKTAIDPKKQYRYRVRSISGADTSPYSEVTVSAKPYSAEANVCTE